MTTSYLRGLSVAGLLITELATSNLASAITPYSTTVSASSKNSHSGYIAPVGRRIKEISAAGAVNFCFERVLGDTGALTLAYSTYSAFNVTAGSNYTAASGALNWADGEVGVKCTKIVVSSMPAGPGIIGIDLTGNAYRNRDYILLNNGSVYPGAKYVSSPGTSDSSSNTSGAGTASSPWQNPSYALSQMSGGGLLYMRGGTYRDLKRYSGETGSGINIPGVVFSKTLPLIIMPYPGENVVVDQGYSGSSDGQGYNASSAFYLRKQASEVFILGSITAQNMTAPGVISYSDALGSYSNDVTIYKLTVQNINSSGSNIAGIKLNSANNWIVQDSLIQRIYTTESGQSSNPYDSTAAGIANGIQVFGSQNYSFVKNTFDVVAKGIAIKGVPDSAAGKNLTMDVDHNLFLRMYDGCVVLEGYQYGGTTAGIVQTLIRYNVSDNPSASSDSARTANFLQTWILESSGSPQATGLQVYNNVLRNVGTTSGSGPIDFKDVADVWVWSNIFDNSVNHQISVGAGSKTTQLAYADYNNYYSGASTWLVNRTPYNLSGWKVLSLLSFLTGSSRDANATTLAPNYSNISLRDYRITSGSLLTAGRFGQPMGVGVETVGANSVDSDNLTAVASPPNSPSQLTITPQQ